eukprot:scaffold326353_cov55-Tisochrysis_lutea.AAC.2
MAVGLSGGLEGQACCADKTRLPHPTRTLRALEPRASQPRDRVVWVWPLWGLLASRKAPARRSAAGGLVGTRSEAPQQPER